MASPTGSSTGMEKARISANVEAYGPGSEPSQKDKDEVYLARVGKKQLLKVQAMLLNDVKRRN